MAYSNPAVSIHVERKPKAKEEQWVPELVVGLGEFLLDSFHLSSPRVSASLFRLPTALTFTCEFFW